MAVTWLAGPLGQLVRPAVSAVVGDIWRRWRVNRHFMVRDPLEPTPMVKRAIGDLEIPIGHNTPLTESIANLLEDLKSTGLLGLIARDAFYDADDDGVRFHFEAMFVRHSQHLSVSEQEASCRELYRTIRLLLRESIRIQAGADLLFIFDTFIKPQSRGPEPLPEEKRRLVISDIRPDLVKRIALSGQSLVALHGDPAKRASALDKNQYPAWLYLTPLQLTRQVEAVSSALIPAYQFVRLDGPAQRSCDCEIDKLYIPARLVEADFSLKSQALQARDEAEASFADLIPQAPQCVVLGDPGGGKSTLAQRICLDALRVSAHDGRLPLAVKIEVRRFVRKTGQGAFDNLIDFVASEVARQANIPSTDLDLVSLIQHLLFFGRMIIVFDGVDEIVSSPRRREVIATTQQLANRFLQNRFVYTCRRTDFLTTPISGIQIFILQQFSASEVQEYFRSASRHVFEYTEEEIAAREADFVKQAFAHASEFVKSPLLLALIVWIYNVGQHIPDNRVELYQECSELLFRRWDSLKEIDPDLPDAHWLFQLVTEIAHRLYLLTSDEGESNDAWLKARVLEFFRRVYDGDVENRARAAAERFVGHLIGRSWVLQERTAGIFEFTHRTFMEYYFARWLDDVYDGIDVLFEHVAPRIRAGEWTVPVHLAFQLKAAGKLRSAEALTTALIKLIETTHAADEEVKRNRPLRPFELPNVVRFVVASIGYLQPSEASMVRITKSLSSVVATKAEWFSTIGDIVASPTEFQGAIAEGVHQALADDIANRKGYTVGFVVDWLYACYLSKRTRHAVPFPGHVLRFSDVRQRFGPRFLAQLEAKDGGLASLPKMTFDLTGVTTSAVTQVGLGMWSASITPDQRLDWRFIDFGLGFMESMDVLMGDASEAQCPYISFFAALSSILPTQRNYSISGGVTVIASFDFSRLQSLVGRLEGCPLNIALSFSTAAIGFSELASRLGIIPASQAGHDAVSRTSRATTSAGPNQDVVRQLLREISGRADMPSEFTGFIDGWVANSHAMFNAFERIQYVNHATAFSGLEAHIRTVDRKVSASG
jgi:hypothetical protein